MGRHEHHLHTGMEYKKKETGNDLLNCTEECIIREGKDSTNEATGRKKQIDKQLPC